MQFPFANGSYAEPQRFTWTMYYPWPVTYPNEPGLLIHLSPADAGSVNGTLNAAAVALGGVIGPALDAFAVAAVQLAEHFVENSDGSLDIRFSEHGLEFGSAPSADPNVWLGPIWGPVAAALRAVAGIEQTVSAADLSPGAPPVPHGKLEASKPLDLPASTS